MKWIDVKKEKPSGKNVVLVVNINYGYQLLIAIYHPVDDVFIWCNPDLRETVPLAPTHWVDIPEFPRHE